MLRDNAPITLQCIYLVDYDDVLGFDCDQAVADAAVFEILARCAVLEAGVIVTEACVGDMTTPIVDFDKRPTAGSDTDRGAADIAHLVLGTSVAGVVMYDLVATGTILYPGEEVVVELATRAEDSGVYGSGHIRPYLLVEYLPEVAANLTDKVETA